MRRRLFSLAAILPIFCGVAWGQHAAPPTAGYHRLICVVQLTGTGKSSDPIRPEFTPAPDLRATPRAGSRTGILAWSFQLSDDRKMAIVQYVAAHRPALETILGSKDKRPDIRVFEIGRDKKEDIEKELKKFKRDFDLDKLQAIVR